MNKAGELRRLLSRDGIVPVPGVYDALTAKVAQYCQFECVYMTGYGTAASFGYPDIGLMMTCEKILHMQKGFQSGGAVIGFGCPVPVSSHDEYHGIPGCPA